MRFLTFSRRSVAAGIMALLLISCAAPDPLGKPQIPMGDFALGFNIVVADKMQQVPPSRDATPEEWIAVISSEINRRFGAYEGDKLYHIALSVDAYSLAPPGIPVLLSPKSVLVISANIWDDAAGVKLHDAPNQITIFEGASPDTIFGSGFTHDREEQMQILARNAAKRVQAWMLENPQWFGIDPDAANAALEGFDVPPDPLAEADLSAFEALEMVVAETSATPTFTPVPRPAP
ncbi:MAG: hypothetical protein O2824_01430 [Proteobacteria bacterium]|nr:hypothetical protein [Pseudomonadota bacterium]